MQQNWSTALNGHTKLHKSTLIKKPQGTKNTMIETLDVLLLGMVTWS